MMRLVRRLRTLPMALLLLLPSSGCDRLRRWGAPEPISEADIAALHASPATPRTGKLTVFHLGHSLVGRDMPAMLQQLAGAGHAYDSQLGWGASLRQHWEPSEEIPGFDTENGHPRYRDVGQALDSGEYDALVLTEMVEIRDAIKWHHSAEYLQRFARRAWKHSPKTRVYLYETWHDIEHPEGFLTRIDRDLRMYWEQEILDRALAHDAMQQPIYVIPAGQVLARFIREVKKRGGVEGISRKEDLFATAEDGSQDTIHFGDLGAYLVAVVHYAVLYQRDPTGLPHALTNAGGEPMTAPSAEAARLMQEVTWEVLTHYPRTGVAQAVR